MALDGNARGAARRRQVSAVHSLRAAGDPGLPSPTVRFFRVASRALRGDASGTAYKLVQVVDRRHFEARPRQANQPSMTQANLGKPDVVARAVGRRRGSFGKARGEIMFASGSPVTKVVSSCVGAALARAGAVLVDENDPRHANALPMHVHIDRFWTWFRPGAWVVAAEFDATLTVQAPMSGFEHGRAVQAHAELRGGMINAARYRSVIKSGLAALTENLSQEFVSALRVPHPAVAVAP